MLQRKWLKCRETGSCNVCLKFIDDVVGKMNPVLRWEWTKLISFKTEISFLRLQHQNFDLVNLYRIGKFSQNVCELSVNDRFLKSKLLVRSVMRTVQYCLRPWESVAARLLEIRSSLITPTNTFRSYFLMCETRNCIQISVNLSCFTFVETQLNIELKPFGDILVLI